MNSDHKLLLEILTVLGECNELDILRHLNLLKTHFTVPIWSQEYLKSLLFDLEVQGFISQ